MPTVNQNQTQTQTKNQPQQQPQPRPQTKKSTSAFTAADEAVKNFKNTKTKAGKSELKRLKSERNKAYSDNKKFLTEFEKTNFSYLVLLKSTNDFYKLIGHSALFYALNIAPKLNLTANLTTDGDYTYKSAEGIVSVREPEKLAEILKTLGIKQLRPRHNPDDFILFKLPWTFTETQLADMQDQQNQSLRHFNQLVMVDNIIPVLFLQLEELLKIIYENSRTLPSQFDRDTFGKPLTDTANKMACTYFDLTNGCINRVNCFKNLKSDLTFIKYQVKLLTDLKLWQPKTSARAADVITKIKDILDRESKKP